MFNLQDAGPLLPLGGLFLMGSREGSNNPDLVDRVTTRNATGGETGLGYLAGGFAAGSSEWAAQQLRQAAGLDSNTVPDELAQALVGVGVSNMNMIPRNKAMARGIHYNVATQAFQDLGVTLGDFAGDVDLGNGGSNGGSSAPAAAPAPQASNPSIGGNEVVY